jgi:hypothetical protein
VDSWVKPVFSGDFWRFERKFGDQRKAQQTTQQAIKQRFTLEFVDIWAEN